ncbi:hypothetical protein PG990_009802 [Apiospora arundinis]
MSSTGDNRALDNNTVQNNSVNNAPQQQQQQHETQNQQPHNTHRQTQGSVTTRRRLTSTIGHGMLPLSEGLSIQEYERRRQHNTRQAEENKKEQRERNNEAARRSRQRRADLIADQKAEIDCLKQENGALKSERDYWKGVVIEIQGRVGGVGGAGSAQQQQHPRQLQSSSASQNLACPAGMAPSAASHGNVPVAPTAQMSAPRMPASQFPPQMPNHAGSNNFAGFDFQQSSGAPVANMSSDAPVNFDEAEFLKQLEQYSAQVADGDALDNFDFSVPGNGA